MDTDLRKNLSANLDKTFFTNESFECSEFKIEHDSNNYLDKNLDNSITNR
jgi:hypothetical protein